MGMAADAGLEPMPAWMAWNWRLSHCLVRVWAPRRFGFMVTSRGSVLCNSWNNSPARRSVICARENG
jgi:hypothetical protein